MTGPCTHLKGTLLRLLCLLGGATLVAQTVLPMATPLRAYDKGFREPVRLATDHAGRLFVSDARLGLITIRDESGCLVGVKRGLNKPLGVAVDASGRIFVCEAGLGRVSIFTPGWTPAGALGQGNGEFQMPNHLLIQPDGRVYVVDSVANQVKVFGTDNQRLMQFGVSGTLDGQLNFPTGIAVTPAGEIFVSDQGNERIQVFDAAGTFLRKFGGLVGMTGSNTTFGRVQGMLADASGRIFLADSFRGVVTVVNASGTILGAIGTFGSEAGHLMGSASLALDQHNRLFVATPSNTRVEVFGLDTFSDPHILSADLTVYPYELRREDVRRPTGPERRPRFGDLRAGTEDQPEFRGHARELAQDDGEDLEGREPSGDSRAAGSKRSARAPRVMANRTDLLFVLIKIPGVDPASIQAGSITANGLPALPVSGVAIADFDGDGSLEFRAWFNRRAILSKLPDGDGFLVLSGRLSDGRYFESIADMKVINTGGGAQ